MRTMILHPGGGKTGSSAIQNFLFHHSVTLKKLGFSYANSHDPLHAFGINSGNGLALVEILNAQASNNELIEKCIEAYFGGLNKAIISSEMFETLTPGGWDLLVDSCNARGIIIKIIFFVRNTASYIVSAYDQAVKRHGEWRGLNEWVSVSTWSHYETLRRLSKSLSDSDVQVFSYDAERSGLLSAFLKGLELDERDFFYDATIPNVLVNRSLTSSERDCLRLVNKLFGELYSRDLSDHFIYTRPTIQAEPESLSEPSFCFLEEKYGEAAEWINKNYFSGSPVVSVRNPEVIDNSISSPSVGGRNSDLQAKDVFISWLLDKISKPQMDVAQSFCQCFTNIDWDQACHPFVPPDFDPFAYLLNNLDVAIAKAKPYQHYIAFGRNEGREYKWIV